MQCERYDENGLKDARMTKFSNFGTTMSTWMYRKLPGRIFLQEKS